MERPSRKLRHERKNRAKKVGHPQIVRFRWLTPFAYQVRGTKKTKAAEPPKKGK